MSLEGFWRFLEARPGGAAVLLEWERRCGSGIASVRSLLRATGDSASLYPPAVVGRPPMRIVHHGDGTINAICDEGRSERLTLTKDDRALHAVDLAALRGRICDALQLRTARDPLNALPGGLRVGAWEPKPSLRIPVTLLVARDERALRMALHDATLAARKPTIVLTPTRDLWHDSALALAEERKAMLAPVCELIMARDEEWVASEAWNLSLGQFVQAAGIRMAGGVSDLKKKVQVAKKGATAAKLKDGIKAWGVGAKKRMLETGELLPLPEVKMLAKECGVDPSTASRWLNGRYSDQDKELKTMWAGARNPDYVRRFPT